MVTKRDKPEEMLSEIHKLQKKVVELKDENDRVWRKKDEIMCYYNGIKTKLYTEMEDNAYYKVWIGILLSIDMALVIALIIFLTTN